MHALQPDWTINGKIPVIWGVDDLNTALSASCRKGVPLFYEKGFGRFRQFVEKFKATFFTNFVVFPEYAQAGLTALRDLEIPLTDTLLRPYHQELQKWLVELGPRAQVTVHAWKHRMEAYTPDIEINPGGSEYTRRSEWLYNPDPVENYRRCFNTLKELGYQPIPHVFSTCGGRMDRKTLRALRNSEFGVLTHFTPAKSCQVDYPDVPEMPWYLVDVDAFVLPFLGWKSKREEFISLLDRQKPIVFFNHGYEFYDPWFQDHPLDVFAQILQENQNKLIFVQLGDYIQYVHNRVLPAQRR